MVGNRVVVTGMGLITPVGIGKERFWESIRAGISGIKRIESFDPSEYPAQIAGEVRDFQPEDFMGSRKANQCNRIAQFAIAAARSAVNDAGLEGELNLDKSSHPPLEKRKNGRDFGVILGTCYGGMGSAEEGYQRFYQMGWRKVKPNSILQIMYNAAADHIAIELGIRGPNLTVATACSSAAVAIGQAFNMIRDGYCERMLAGGADAPIKPGILSSWIAIKLLSERNDAPQKACRPFSMDRDGIVIGEGAAMVVIESLNSAIKRDARIYAEIIGYGINSDATHIIKPDVEGEADALESALFDANIKYHEVDYINAHSPGALLTDRVETDAIKRVFKEHAYKVPISSTKSMTGHTMGASGAIELIVTILSINNNLITPTINYDIPDPDCDLDYVPNSSREAEIDIAISNSFGFGGTNAVLVVKRFS